MKRLTCHPTSSQHPYARYPTLVERLQVQRPEQVWVSDISHIRLGRGFVHLALIMDGFSRNIRGWNLTLQQFAKSVGYRAHGYISELEAGKKTPTVEFVLSVSRYYGVSTDELIRDEIELAMRPREAGE